jgi:hypothetical protein
MKSKSKWLDWVPGAETAPKHLDVEASKPSKPSFVGFEGAPREAFPITRDASSENPIESGENRSPDLKVPVNQSGAPLANGRHLYPAAAEGPCNFVPGTLIPLPFGVRVLRYIPQPRAEKGASIRNSDVSKIIKSQLADLDARLNHPVQIRGGGSVFEILGKLDDVGLELAIERPRAGSPDGLLEVVTESAQPEQEPVHIEVGCSVKRPVDQASPEIMEKAPDHEPSKPTEPDLAGPKDASEHSVGIPTSETCESKACQSGAASGANFVHLHLHTDYSLLDGACEIGKLTAEAARQGMPAVAVTDHGNLFAAANFYHEATTRGVKPIIGCEVYVAPDGHRSRGTSAARSNHLVLLAENEEGYRNLIQLVSTSFLDGFYYKPRVDHDLLQQHSKGLIALSACLRGEVADALVSEKYDQAKTNAYRLRDIFGKGNFFLEVQDQGMEIETRINRDLVQLSRETGIPLVATNDCHYLTRSDAHAQEVLMCIQTGKTMSDSQRMKFPTDQFYFKTAEEMAEVFRELPDAVSRTVTIADRCNVKIQRVTNPFPEFKVPEGFTADSYFEKVVREGFLTRAPLLERQAAENRLRHPLPVYESRLTSEIEMIKKMRFAGYFLIVWDFIHYARAQGVPVGPGRGSAAGSLVSYALHITDVDPLQYDLLFERFLNPERVSLPDIDIDFCMRRRGEVIDYVRQKYGDKSVAQIITFRDDGGEGGAERRGPRARHAIRRR